MPSNYCMVLYQRLKCHWIQTSDQSITYGMLIAVHQSASNRPLCQLQLQLQTVFREIDQGSGNSVKDKCGSLLILLFNVGQDVNWTIFTLLSSHQHSKAAFDISLVAIGIDSRWGKILL